MGRLSIVGNHAKRFYVEDQPPESSLGNMFLGHYGLALAAKKLAPKVSLGTLLFASQLIDLIWPILLLLHFEEVAIVPGITLVTPLDFVSYPYSHSLLAVALWAALIGLAYYIWKHSRVGALVLGALVLSHWLLDFVVHRPDLPLLPDDPVRYGLGYWNSYPITLTLELGVFLIGLFIYQRTTHPRDRLGKYLLLASAVLLLAIYLSSIFGPPPPDAKSIAIVGLGQWLFVALFYWMDRHRRAYV
jgi:membrane-bound metal-dependent hydrolase YbcI (DUF457 family)